MVNLSIGLGENINDFQFDYEFQIISQSCFFLATFKNLLYKNVENLFTGGCHEQEKNN